MLETLLSALVTLPSFGVKFDDSHPATVHSPL